MNFTAITITENPLQAVVTANETTIHSQIPL